MKTKICQLAAAVFASTMVVLFLGLSFAAIMQISSPWEAVHYWLAWFSFFSGLAGAVCLIPSAIATAAFFDGLCGS